MFKSVEQRVPLKEIIVNQIEEAILNKKYLPGSKLPTESAFSKLFNVSRTSVREAIQILSARGLVKVEKGRGIYVKDITSESVIDPLKKYLQLKLDKESILDLTHARQIIEPSIARDAAIHRTDEDIELLMHDMEALENSHGSFDELARLDNSFHLSLAKATHNVIIPLILQPIHRLLPEIKPFVYANVGDAKESALIYHRKIFDSVKEGDAKSAFKHMTVHLEFAEKHAEKVFQINLKNKK